MVGFLDTAVQRQFTSNVFVEFAEFIDAQQHHIIHNVMVKWNINSWIDVLPTVLIGMRTVHKEDLNASAAEFLYCQENLNLPGQFFSKVKDRQSKYFFNPFEICN